MYTSWFLFLIALITTIVVVVAVEVDGNHLQRVFLGVIVHVDIGEILGAQCKELGKGLGKILEKQVLVVGVHADILVELVIFLEDHVGGEHHDVIWSRKQEFVLGRSVPLAKRPNEPGKIEQSVIGIVEFVFFELPRSVVAGNFGVAPADRMGTTQDDDFLVIKAHSSEHLP